MILDSIDNMRVKKKCPDIDYFFYFLSKAVVANIYKDTLVDFILQLIPLKVLVNKKTPNECDSLYLSNVDTTAPKHVCNELSKLNDITFQDKRYKVPEVRRSDTTFNESEIPQNPLSEKM